MQSGKKNVFEDVCVLVVAFMTKRLRVAFDIGDLSETPASTHVLSFNPTKSTNNHSSLHSTQSLASNDLNVHLTLQNPILDCAPSPQFERNSRVVKLGVQKSETAISTVTIPLSRNGVAAQQSGGDESVGAARRAGPRA